MKIRKNLSIVSILVLCMYFNVITSQNRDIINIYRGVKFDGAIVLFLYEFLGISSFCICIYNEFETYIYEYGIYIVTREKSRVIMLWRFILKLLSYILMLELIKVVIFYCLMLFLHHKITMYNPLEFLKSFSLNFIVYTILLFIQMMLEIYIGGKVALVIVMSYYLFSVGLGTILYSSNSSLNIFLLPNLIMKYRLDVLIKEFNLSYSGILSVLVSITLVILLISHKLFVKKDII